MHYLFFLRALAAETAIQVLQPTVPEYYPEEEEEEDPVSVLDTPFKFVKTTFSDIKNPFNILALD